MSDALMALKHRVESGFRIFGDGGIQQVDMRDLASFIASLVKQQETGRFLIPGVYVKWRILADIVERTYGSSINRIEAKGWKLRIIGKLIDFIRLFKKVDTPISAETMRYATLWPNIKNAAEISQRGIQLRSTQEAFSDTIE